MMADATWVKWALKADWSTSAIDHHMVPLLYRRKSPASRLFDSRYCIGAEIAQCHKATRSEFERAAASSG
jgi:hypothetical protein